MAPDLAVEQLRAYRILASGLAREAGQVATLRIWDWGVQDTGAGSARLAVANRLADPMTVPEFGEPDSTSTLAMGWTWRGSPHVHRREDFPKLAAALWPADASDATTRLFGSGRGLADAGADPVQAYRAVAQAFRKVVTAPMTKGAASTGVTRALAADYSSFCRPCGVTHVREMLFRVAALPAAIGIVPDTKPVVLAPFPAPDPIPPAQTGLAEFADLYFGLYGVGTAAEIGTAMGTSGRAARTVLGDTVAVTVDGRRTLANAESLDLVSGVDVAEARPVVRLLGPSDPLLMARDRVTLVAERERQQLLWPMLGPPGAVLAGGGIAGVWRTRQTAKKLTVTVAGWRRLAVGERRAVEQEAELVGHLRGSAAIELVVED